MPRCREERTTRVWQRQDSEGGRIPPRFCHLRHRPPQIFNTEVRVHRRRQPGLRLSEQRLRLGEPDGSNRRARPEDETPPRIRGRSTCPKPETPIFRRPTVVGAGRTRLDFANDLTAFATGIVYEDGVPLVGDAESMRVTPNGVVDGAGFDDFPNRTDPRGSDVTAQVTTVHPESGS